MSGDAHGALRTAFVDAVLAPDPHAAPDGFDAHAARRFRIHRNNVHRALGDALAQAYPAVQRLVGETFFRALAREYSAHSTPREASLTLWGDGFAEFLASFPPAAPVVYLADVARLERAWLESLHSMDAPALDAAALSGPGDDLPRLRLKAHPAARLVASTHPVVTIWRHNREHPDGDPGPLVLGDRGEHALVTRPALQVQVRALDAPAAAFARALLDGHPVSEAFGQASVAGPLDVATTFADLLRAGSFTHPPERG